MPLVKTAYAGPVVVRQPVRGGQVIYAQNNDLVVLAPVNAGAQVVADGHVHIYAKLRGRAVAGAKGLPGARVFCQNLEAELVAVSGAYMSADEIPPRCAASRRRSGSRTASASRRDRCRKADSQKICAASVELTASNEKFAKVARRNNQGKGGSQCPKSSSSPRARAGSERPPPAPTSRPASRCEGLKTVAIDFDVGLRNLDLVMGCERRVVYDFVNVIRNEAKLQQTLIRDKRVENLYVLPASQTRDKDALSAEGVGRVIDELKEMGFDYIICDSPAGIEKGAQMAMYFADEAIVVTNPEVSSVRDSDRVLGLLAAKTSRAELGGEPIRTHLLLTRYSPAMVKKGEMLSVGDVLELLGIPLLGVIPESKAVLQSSNKGAPAILDETTDVAQAYLDVVYRFLGQDRQHRFIEEEKRGFFGRLFG